MKAQEQTLFRKETMDRISSPEDLTDYLKVTNPGIWIVLVAVIVLLAGIFSWACVGTLETTSKAAIVVKDHNAVVVLVEGGELQGGMPLRVSGVESKIAGVEQDQYGRSVGTAEITLPDGQYEGTVVTDQTRPIDFLMKPGVN
jgi:hypothetical protein